MYQRFRNSVCFDILTEAPAKAGVWGWVKLAHTATGGEGQRSDLKNRVKNVSTLKYIIAAKRRTCHKTATGAFFIYARTGQRISS